MRTLSVICPVYNEEEVLPLFWEEINRVLQTLTDKYSYTLTFVLDKGTDNSLQILQGIAATHPWVRVLAMSSRFGHQAALLAGIDCSDADAIVMLDSDLEHPPELIPRLLEEFENGYDIVYTIRHYPAQVGFLKRTTSKMFYSFINSISQIQVNQNSPDYRLISRRVALVFQHELRERNQFLRGLMSWVGFKTACISFDSRTRQAGKTKYSPARMIRFGIHGVISFSKKPLQWAIYTGIFFAAFGFYIGGITAIQFLLYHSFPSGYTTLTVLISMYAGIQLIFLGIIGEYIAAIFDEVKARPHYIIEEKLNFH